MKKIITAIALIVVLFIMLRFGYSLAIQKYMINKMKVKIIPSVDVISVEEESVVKVFETHGRVESSSKINVVARVSGYLEKSYFIEGDSVRKGELLFLIEDTQYRNELNSLYGNLNNIQAKLSFAQRQLERGSELVKNDYIAKARYDELLSTRNSYMAQLDTAKSNYEDAKRNLSYTRVKSPINGKIGRINISIGNYITPSSPELATIYSTDPMYVLFNLPVEDYESMLIIDKNNYTPRKTEIYFSNGEKYEYFGSQNFSDTKIDKSMGTVLLRANFKNNNNRLLDGEFVNVKLYSNNKTKIPVIPVYAVLENQEGKYVYTIDDKNIAHVTYIEIQEQSDNKYYVKKGLKKGDIVIISGLINVTPESKVSVKERGFDK